ncbi:MAG: enoyl-CoA hydratase/isomerase family protein [Promethearchaeia archaeon]
MSEKNEILLFKIKRRVAYLTINRPDSAHAFNLTLMKKFYQALKRADESEKVKCILVKSTGNRTFSAGIDIRNMPEKNQEEYMNKMREFGRKITQYMLLMKKPIIAQVQGSAIGFGMEVIMACDLKMFADKPLDQMKFRMPEIAISIYPQTGATILPLLSFGLNFAKRILLTSDEFGLEELKNMNFPTRVFPPERLEIETKKFLRTFTKRSESFSFLIKSSLTIMNNKLIKRWYDLEDECGETSYKKLSMQELEEFINGLFEKYP